MLQRRVPLNFLDLIILEIRRRLVGKEMGYRLLRSDNQNQVLSPRQVSCWPHENHCKKIKRDSSAKKFPRPRPDGNFNLRVVMPKASIRGAAHERIEWRIDSFEVTTKTRFFLPRQVSSWPHENHCKKIKRDSSLYLYISSRFTNSR